MRLFATIILLTLIACDPYSEAHLCNESNNDLEVIIKIDQDFVETNWQGHQQVRFLKEFGSSNNLVEISTDSVSLTGVYNLEKGKCSILYEGISSTPRLMINYLKISSSKKSIVFDSREQIEKAFLHEEGSKYRLTLNSEFNN